jgi:hypothetical protein
MGSEHGLISRLLLYIERLVGCRNVKWNLHKHMALIWGRRIWRLHCGVDGVGSDLASKRDSNVTDTLDC